MKVVKPNRLGVLQRVVEHRRRPTLAVGVLVAVELGAPKRPRMEQALWRDVADCLPGGVLDEGYPKARAEVLVAGRAFALGAPAKAVLCKLAVKRAERTLVSKTLAVFGDRWWEGDTASEATPFESMPVDWTHAFGGASEPRNPSGKGAPPLEDALPAARPLPNVEDPEHLLASPDDRPEPVGFMGYDFAWPQRQKLLGTQYDERWLKELSPGPAADFDVGFYNVAARDQQLEGAFRPGDVIEVSGMHPTKARVSLAVPDLVVRVFTAKTLTGAPRLTPYETRLDTVLVVPDRELAFLIYRAAIAVEEDDAADVAALVLAAEDPTRPRELEHYEGVLERRLDKVRGALAMMRDSELMPPAELGWTVASDYGDMVEMTGLEQRAVAKAERARRERMREAREAFVQAGLEVPVELHDAPEPAPIDPLDVDGLERLADELSAKAASETSAMEAEQQRAVAKARSSFAEIGLDYDEVMAAGANDAAGPKRFSADEFLIAMHEVVRMAREAGEPLEELERDLTDPRYDAALRALEERAHEGYLKTAHLLAPLAPPTADDRALLRTKVSLAKDVGESLAGKDLRGADLGDMDLRGVDMSGALLDGANFSGADLSAANLDRAVLAHAKLERARLIGATLRGANLGSARLNDADLSQADLSEATLMRSDFTGVTAHGANFRGADFLEASFERTSLAHADLSEVFFFQADLRQASFVGARLAKVRMLNCDVRGVDFTGGDLSGAQFVQTCGDGASFAGANLTGAILLHESSFEECSFAGSNLEQANLAGTPLARGNFDGARMNGASVLGSDLREARLRGVSARGGLWIRADLRGADASGSDFLGALLSKGKWQGANLARVNLSRADVSRVRTDGGTRLEGALSLDTRVDPRFDASHEGGHRER